VPGAEYDRDPDQIEFQARLIAAAPKLMDLAARLLSSVDEAPDDAPPEMRALAREARTILKSVTDVLAAPTLDSAATPAPQAPDRSRIAECDSRDSPRSRTLIQG
jgi:hypothetical protein